MSKLKLYTQYVITNVLGLTCNWTTFSAKKRPCMQTLVGWVLFVFPHMLWFVCYYWRVTSSTQVWFTNSNWHAIPHILKQLACHRWANMASRMCQLRCSFVFCGCLHWNDWSATALRLTALRLTAMCFGSSQRHLTWVLWQHRALWTLFQHLVILQADKTSIDAS